MYVILVACIHLAHIYTQHIPLHVPKKHTFPFIAAVHSFFFTLTDILHTFVFSSHAYSLLFFPWLAMWQIVLRLFYFLIVHFTQRTVIFFSNVECGMHSVFAFDLVLHFENKVAFVWRHWPRAKRYMDVIRVMYIYHVYVWHGNQSLVSNPTIGM